MLLRTAGRRRPRPRPRALRTGPPRPVGGQPRPLTPQPPAPTAAGPTADSDPPRTDPRAWAREARGPPSACSAHTSSGAGEAGTAARDLKGAPGDTVTAAGRPPPFVAVAPGAAHTQRRRWANGSAGRGRAGRRSQSECAGAERGPPHLDAAAARPVLARRR